MKVGGKGSGIFVMIGRTVEVTGMLTIGNALAGLEGTFHISGRGNVSAGHLSMNTRSRLELSSWASLVLGGDQLVGTRLNTYIASGQVVSATNSGEPYIVYDCMKNSTMLRAALPNIAVTMV